jgi:hypothetical protein
MWTMVPRFLTTYKVGNKTIDLSNVNGTPFDFSTIGGHETLWFMKTEAKSLGIFSDGGSIRRFPESRIMRHMNAVGVVGASLTIEQPTSATTVGWRRKTRIGCYLIGSTTGGLPGKFDE